MAQPSTGKIFGISGIVDVPGGASEKFAVRPDGVLAHREVMATRKVDSRGFGDGIEDAQTVIGLIGSGTITAKLPISVNLGLANLGDTTNGTGTLQVLTGNGKKVSGPVLIDALTLIARGSDSVTVSIAWTRNGAWTEANA